MLLLAALAFTLFDELTFRRYLNHHSPLIGGCLPNFLAALLLILLYALARSPISNQKGLSASAAVAAGLILYEVAQIWMPRRTFDIADIAASLIGGAAGYGLIRLVNGRKSLH